MTCNGCPMPAISETILAELREIRAILQPKRCSNGDLETLACLLPAWAGAFGSNFVTTREIMADAGIRGVLKLSNGSIGLLLGKATDDRVVIGDLQVERSGKEHSARLWRVVKKLPETFARGA